MRTKKELMLRTFGFSQLSPHKENRIILYSLLLTLLATAIYILSYYLNPSNPTEPEETKEYYEKLENRKRNAPDAAHRPNMKPGNPLCRNENFLNFSSGVEPLKSFTIER